VNDLDRDTHKSKENMRMPLIKMKEIKSNSRKCEHDTCENESVKKQHLRKLTEIKVQMQVRETVNESML